MARLVSKTDHIVGQSLSPDNGRDDEPPGDVTDYHRVVPRLRLRRELASVTPAVLGWVQGGAGAAGFPKTTDGTSTDQRWLVVLGPSKPASAQQTSRT